jgi:hypothetical protein
MTDHESTREADTRAVQRVDRQRAAIDGRNASAAKRSKEARSNVGPDRPGARVPFRRDAFEDPRSVRPEVAVRVSLIDGADRLVYVDVRDARGWKQPLAIQEAASELRHRPSAVDGVSMSESISEPRTVRTAEMAQMARVARPLAPPDQVNSMSVSKSPTPYSLGKRSVSASASPLHRHQQQQVRTSSSSSARAPGPPAQATAQAPTRSR